VTLLKIAQVGNPILRQRAREVSREELRSLEMQRFIDDLVETMRDANGAGLAAIQVHNPIRICAIEVADNPRYPYKPNVPLTILVNPVLTPLSDEKFVNYEGCLSVPDLRGEVERFDNFEGCLSVPDMRGVAPRFAELRVQAWDRNGEPIDREVRGVTAGTFQHEVDHLDGKLFLDRVTDTRTLATWAEFDRFHKQVFVERIVPFIAKWGG
jgi:peptide deformylase